MLRITGQGLLMAGLRAAAEAGRPCHLWARWFLVGHVLAMILGLFGLIIAVPRAASWEMDRWTNQLYDVGVAYGSLLHIVLGTLTMLAYGISAQGSRRTLRFCALVFIVSLTMEYVGVTTGWPFGDYAYTQRLGPMILGTVPVAIPLSWCYMGLAAAYLGGRFAPAGAGRSSAVLSIVLPAALLVMWDFGLELAVAHEGARLQYWVWNEDGAYFGVPLQNFVGWAMTACLCFIACRSVGVLPCPRRGRQRIPTAVYAVNGAFVAAVGFTNII